MLRRFIGTLLFEAVSSERGGAILLVSQID